MITSHKFAIIFPVLITLFLIGCTPQQEETVRVAAVEIQSEGSAAVDAEFPSKPLPKAENCST